MNFKYPPLVEKLAPETVRVVSAVVEAVIEGGDTLLIEGAGVAACSGKVAAIGSVSIAIDHLHRPCFRQCRRCLIGKPTASKLPILCAPGAKC